MVTALYRRYRPENFAELIGQAQVTDPLRTALRADRVNHAYLFSGPRGCGKTTSARILARCLNCEQGPTDTPCGVCASCVELSRDGGGSLDVIEIDAASHNGVDDARDIRDRAVFAPARDRFKIFILDEAHMVTPQGFNALLKVVEEPPEHVKFIFATTEPDKVIGTIRSRTHHYPFRLVPPAQMLDYVHELCESEGVSAAPGVLPLVVRAGGGSVRDTLSLLDQLMAGSEGGTVEYERAVALLGYTHAALLDDVVDALGLRDGAAAFAAVDRVVQTGQDPRRFVEDLLERLRDLIVVGATAEGAAAVLRGVTADELERLTHQAAAFGAAQLSRAADVVARALNDMTGATSPRLHLELMIARVLVPEHDETERGALARVERLERRVGVQGPDAAASVPVAAPTAAGPEARAASAGPVAPAPSAAAQGPTGTAAPATPTAGGRPQESSTEPAPPTAAHSAAWAQAPSVEAVPAERAPGEPVGPVSLQQIRDSWPEIVEVVQQAKRTAWLVVVTATPRAYADEVLTLTFPSAVDVEAFKKPQGAGDGVSEHLRRAIQQVLGIKVKYVAKVEGPVEPGPGQGDGPPRDGAAPGGSAQRGAPAGGEPGAVASGPAGRVTPPSPSTPEPVAPAPASAPAPVPSSAPAPTTASSPAPAPARTRAASRPAEAADQGRAPGPVTGWDVAPIPQSGPPEPDEPEHITEEPPGGAPTVDAGTAPTPPSASAASVPGPATAVPAERRPAAEPAAPAPGAPTVPAGPSAAQRRAAAGDPLRGVPAGSRYGEAVVREILGAQFLGEETIAPVVTPRGNE
ncbi:DNA polymerase III subunit gamma and tau [Frigoribacterium salinisoli]